MLDDAVEEKAGGEKVRIGMVVRLLPQDDMRWKGADYICDHR